MLYITYSTSDVASYSIANKIQILHFVIKTLGDYYNRKYDICGHVID